MAPGLFTYPDITPGPRITTSPPLPSGSKVPSASAIAICVEVGTPTEPGTRAAGGSGLDDIWWLASVMPYASSIGAPYCCSPRASSAGDSAELHERTKRRVSGAPLASALSRII